jgi:hypothetical protein
MNVDLKIDLSKIIAALILAIAAVIVAKTVAPPRDAPPRYVPMGVAEWAGIPTGFYLDTQSGVVGIGPTTPPKK